jgi:alpha-methylacyl-CoA racemase
LQRGTNLLDGAAHFYDTYACADQRHIAVGAIEPAFYQQLLQLAGIEASQLPAQFDRAGWVAAKQQLAQVFATKTQAQWCELLEGSDACCAPVLDMQNAPLHPHAKARSSFVELDGVVQPAPAPRFSRTQPDVPAQSAHQNDESAAILRDWGIA